MHTVLSILEISPVLEKILGYYLKISRDAFLPLLPTVLYDLVLV